jgi:SSS family solute:Na+ symporter
VIAALYWRRATKEGAIASVVATMVVWFYFFAKSGFGGEYFILGGVMPVAVCWLTGAVMMVVVSLATKPPSEETVAKFFP